MVRPLTALAMAAEPLGEESVERWPYPKDDKYYRVPRDLGIARSLPRTKSVSTTELIKRIETTDDK